MFQVLQIGLLMVATVSGMLLSEQTGSWDNPPQICTACTPANRAIEELNSVSLSTCQSRCDTTPFCRYINYAEINGACELFISCLDKMTESSPKCSGIENWWTTYERNTPATGPELWRPTAKGFTGMIKPFWFGASPEGLVNSSTLALIAKHTVGGYGWQTGGVDSTSIGRGDANGAAAVTHARDFLASINNTETMIFQYRQIQVALALFAQSALAAIDPSLEGFWLRNSTTREVCSANQPWGTPDPYWTFRNESAASYWVSRVIDQLVQDGSMQGGGTAVFFDEVDQGQCGYKSHTCDFDQFDLTAEQNGTIAMLPAMVGTLNAGGIVPILSLDNRMVHSGDQLPNTKLPCSIPEDNVVAALANYRWVRFYENWPGTFWQPSGPDTDAAMISNAILEAAASVPTVMHIGGPQCPAPQRNITRPGRLGGPIEFAVASYLIVASEGSTLSVSTGWMDKDYCWWPEFDVEYGVPLGDAVRTGSHKWFRKYSKCTVTIDVSQSRTGTVTLL